MEKVPCKWKPKKAGVAILISDKVDFKTKTVIRDKERYYIKIKGLIQQEVITFVHINTLNIGVPTYIKQILTELKGEIDRNTITVEDFSTPLTSTGQSSKQKIKTVRKHWP